MKWVKELEKRNQRKESVLVCRRRKESSAGRQKGERREKEGRKKGERRRGDQLRSYVIKKMKVVKRERTETGNIGDGRRVKQEEKNGKESKQVDNKMNKSGR